MKQPDGYAQATGGSRMYEASPMNETVNRWLQHLLIATLVGLIGALLALGAALYGPSL